MTFVSTNRVAAIVVTWNSPEIVESCLAALVAQTRPFDRIIVVDNGSNTVESLCSWWGKDPFLIELLTENTGFATANNRGMALCPDCEFVAMINPDAFLEPDWLATMLAAVQRHPEAASFGSVLVQANDSTKLDGLGDAYHMSGLAWRMGYGSAVRVLEEQEIFSPCAAAALYRRQVVVGLGGLDDTFFCYMEDVDLGFRLRLAGWKSFLIPQAVARHVGSACSGGQRSEFAVYHGHRNMVWCFVKNMPTRLLIFLLPLHVLASLLTIAVYAMRGQLSNILFAKMDALRGMHCVWQKRSLIQAQRVVPAREIWRVMDRRLWPWRRRSFQSKSRV